MVQYLFITVLFIAGILAAQSPGTMDAHHHHHMEETEAETVLTGMPSILSLNLPMSMDGSGTSWLPAHSAVRMSMSHSGPWMLMTHGSLVLRYTAQGGSRGESAFSAPNWFMASAQRSIAEGQQLTFRTMVSLDRITEGGDGYPLLLQSGETWNGKALTDRQHPHDVIAELSASYSVAVSPEAGLYLYLGYPGEPALGPTAFMHRPSAQFNPDAPIGHHGQDATHITFGVSTIGVVIGNVKMEGSVFTGREPDEDRWAFDAPRFDSYSGRISYNPTKQLALQASYGSINDPEGHGDDAARFSASVLHSMNLGLESSLHSSVVWGENEEHHVPVRSLLAEATFISGSVGLYGRHESVGKQRGELGFTDGKSTVEQLRQYTAGIRYRVLATDSYSVGLGIQGMVSRVSAYLERYYGKDPVSWQVYLQLQ
ncbi:MAG: hypothetical protein HUU02_08455 [Bacteroidetes bacterium]|nr:hypothetical protein [Bacteroidota bacterium]